MKFNKRATKTNFSLLILELILLISFALFNTSVTQKSNLNSKMKIIEIYSHGAYIPKNLYTSSAFEQNSYKDIEFIAKRRSKNKRILNNNFDKSERNINSTVLNNEIIYDILGNQWSNNTNDLLSEKGFIQGIYSGSIIKSFYSELLGLENSFNNQDINLFLPICKSSDEFNPSGKSLNMKQQNSFSVSDVVETIYEIENKVIVNEDTLTSNCNKKYALSMISKLKGMYPNNNKIEYIKKEIDKKLLNIGIDVYNKEKIIDELNKNIIKHKENDNNEGSKRIIKEQESKTYLNNKKNDYNDFNYPIKTISNKYYSFNTLEKYNTCSTAVTQYNANIIKDNLNSFSSEIDREIKPILKSKLNYIHPIVKNYISNNRNSNFKETLIICEALIKSLANSNTTGFKDLSSQKSILKQCGKLFHKHYYNAMLVDMHQIQLVVRNFFEDLSNTLDQEILTIDNYKDSDSFEILENYKEKKMNNEMKSHNSTEEILNSDFKQNTSISNQKEIYFYDQIKLNELKKYSLYVDSELFQAGVMSFLTQVFGSKSYLPYSGGSLLFEVKNDNNYPTITVYYNENTLLQESISIFSNKIKEKLLSEGDIKIWCKFEYDYDMIVKILLYIVSGICFILTSVIFFSFILNNCDEEDNEVENTTKNIISNAIPIDEQEKPLQNVDNLSFNKMFKTNSTKSKNNNKENNKRLSEDINFDIKNRNEIIQGNDL